MKYAPTLRAVCFITTTLLPKRSVAANAADSRVKSFRNVQHGNVPKI
jgi:hypothetical protein